LKILDGNIPVAVVSKGGGGMIATITGLGSVIHSGIWYYIAMMFYFSIILAAFNIIPMFPLDGGNVVLVIVRKILIKLFGNGKFVKGVLYLFKYYGITIIILLLILVVMNDFVDIVKFIKKIK